MDLSILFVAAPAITAALAPSATEWLWMMDVYGFVLAGLLVAMGGIGDVVGRRRLLLVGSALFGAASVAVALAPDPTLFIAARVALAVAAATLAPSTLSLVRVVFEAPDERRRAVGVWTVAFTGGAVGGPIVGGVLLEHLWWGAAFLVNVPVMVVLLVAGPSVLPESRHPRPGGVDLVGAGLAVGAVLAVVFALKRAAHGGVDPMVVGALALGVASGALLVRRRENPLVDLALLRAPAPAAAVGANAAVAFAASGVGLLAFTYLQVVLGLSPLAAALWALPTLVGTGLGAALAAGRLARARPGALLVAGLLVAAAGFAVLTAVRPAAGLLPFVAGYSALTFGAGVVGTLANATVLSGTPPQRAGAAAGLSETAMELGGALGIAVLGTAATTGYRSAMSTSPAAALVPAQEVETVAGAAAAAARLPGPAGAALLADAADAYTAGVAVAAGTGAVVIVLVAGCAALALRGVPAGRTDDRRPD
ncbi:MFS transporter [Pseudonocardia sp. S2-4]|uniref:MFS transporter n=2 Tax=Pseudonocardia humida TaxID=2800819 RepID=A0ABT1A613_9PSEU|nr:MFS transporter [Pseudonocardia humida]